MAKKKHSQLTQQQKQPEPHTQTQTPQSQLKVAETPQAPPPMEDPSVAEKEKLSNLKSLNSKLLSETLQNREEIKSLAKSKESLQSEVEALRAELTRRKDGGSEAEVAREVVSVFMESQALESLRREKEEAEKRLEEVVKERDEMAKAKVEGDVKIGAMEKLEEQLRVEIRREKEGVNQAVRDKTELTQELSDRVKEVSKLREKLAEFESREMSVVMELKGLKSKYEISTKEVEVKEEEIEVMRDELRSTERNCEELRGEIEGLKAEKETISREKEGLCKERNMINVKVSELEKDVLSVMKDQDKWRAKFIALEESNNRTIVELDELKEELSNVLKEKEEKEGEIERLMGEKSNVVARLRELEEELKIAKRAQEEIREVKVRLEDVKLGQEGEISVLESKLNEVQGNVSLLEGLNRGHLEKMKILASEIDEYKRGLERVSKERDVVKKSLEEEKKNGEKLQVKVSEISKKMEETAKVIEDLRAASDTLVGEKKEIEEEYSKVMEDKGMVQKELGAAKGKIDELEVLMKAKTEMFELALVMLRDTVVQLSMENEKSSGSEGIKMNERGTNGELEPILAELDAMRSVFKRREEKVGEMEKHMERLQCSVLEARKKKSFWTLVSSATSILAAVVSYAYVSEVR